jgi:hypothetical protein
VFMPHTMLCEKHRTISVFQCHVTCLHPAIPL